MAYDRFYDSIKGVSKDLSFLNSDSVLKKELQKQKQTAFAGIGEISDSLAWPMHNFAIAFPTYPKSEYYLYAATVMSESSQRFFETAKWCGEYVKLYPKGRFRKDAIAAAAHNYEKTGSFDKAIEFYDMAAKEYPNSELGKGAKRIAFMLRKGLVTEEEQLEYIITHPDTVQTGN